MKKAIMAFVISMAFIATAQAADFKLMDPSAPITAVGTFIRASNGSTAPGGILVLVSHKQKEVNFLTSVIKGWVPLTAGGSLGKGIGGPSVALGSGFNVVPGSKAALLAFINSISGSAELPGLKKALAPNEQSNVSMFVGVHESLIIHSLQKYGTCLTYFVGPTILFN